MKTKLLTLLAAFCASTTFAFTASLDLASLWQLQLDPKDEGLAAQQWTKPFADTIPLPGTTAPILDSFYEGLPFKLVDLAYGVVNPKVRLA